MGFKGKSGIEIYLMEESKPSMRKNTKQEKINKRANRQKQLLMQGGRRKLREIMLYLI